MRILRLIDINTYIYAGNGIGHAFIEGDLYNSPTGWKTEKLHVGGLSFLFNVIRDFSQNSTIIFTADRVPTKRMEICSDYKATRKLDPETRKQIDIQKAMVEKILIDCNFNVAYCEDWESDDVLYTLSKIFYSDFDHIYIHTSDSDLNMCVTEKVSIAPVRKMDKTVTLENYESNAGKKGEYIEYNLCNFYKMLNGDPSDNYPGVQHYQLREKLQNIFLTKQMSPYVGESVAFGELLKSLLPEVYDNYILAYQQMVPVDVDILKKPDREYIELWGSLLCNNGFMGMKGVSTTAVDSKRKEMLEYVKTFLNQR